MSAETFIQAFENGEPQPIKTKDILECFDGVISNRRADSIDVTFGPQDDSTIYFEVESDEDTGVMVEGYQALAKEVSASIRRALN